MKVPCDSPQGPVHTDRGARRKAEKAKARADEVKQQLEELKDGEFVPKPALDEVTRLLCGLCTELEAMDWDALIDEVDGLREWWEEHKEYDEEQGRR